MTLTELKAIVPAADSNKRVPSISAMLEEGKHIVVKNRINADTDITVYDNGYVLYRTKDHATVFPLHSCEEYTYETNCGEQFCVPSSEFEQQDWMMRLILEGEDRLEYNQNQRMKKITISYHGIAEDWSELADCSKDPLQVFAEISEKKEVRDHLTELVSNLSPRQQFVIKECVMNGKGRRQVAEDLGVSTQAITDALFKAMDKLKTSFGVKF